MTTTFVFVAAEGEEAYPGGGRLRLHERCLARPGIVSCDPQHGIMSSYTLHSTLPCILIVVDILIRRVKSYFLPAIPPVCVTSLRHLFPVVQPLIFLFFHIYKPISSFFLLLHFSYIGSLVTLANFLHKNIIYRKTCAQVVVSRLQRSFYSVRGPLYKSVQGLFVCYPLCSSTTRLLLSYKDQTIFQFFSLFCLSHSLPLQCPCLPQRSPYCSGPWKAQYERFHLIH